MSKYLNQTIRGKKDLFWLMVSKVSAYHGRDGMVDQNSSLHGSQEAEKECLC
jgi:hypothetical protein